MEFVARNPPLGSEVDDGEVGVRTGRDKPLARIAAPGARRRRRRPFDVPVESEPAFRDLGQHDRHLGLDPGEAALAFPDAVGRLFLRQMRCVVRGDHVDRPVMERRPQSLGMTLLADRRVDPELAAQRIHVIDREDQVLRAGLDRHVDAARLGAAYQIQPVGRALVRDMETRPGPLRESGRTADRLDGADLRARGEMGARVVPSRLLHLRLAPGHDRRVLGVDGAAHAEPRQDLEPLQHRPVGRRRQVAEGVSHEALEPAHPGARQIFEVVYVVLVEEAVNPIIDMGLPLGARLLVAQRLQRARRRMGVRHLENRGGSAAGRRRRAGLPVLLVVVSGFAEMDVAVDRARKDVQPTGVDGLARRRGHLAGGDADDPLAVDRDVGLDRRARRDHRPALDQKIDRFHLRAPKSPSRRLRPSPGR